MAEDKAYDKLTPINIPDTPIQNPIEGNDVNAVIDATKKDISEQQTLAKLNIPDTPILDTPPPALGATPDYKQIPGGNNPLAQYYGRGSETPQMNLNTEDIFPGYNEPTIIGETRVGGTNIHTFASGANYIPYNIIAKRQTALNNAAILRNKAKQDANKKWDYNPDKTPHEYTADYNESFYNGIGDLHNKFTAKNGGNSIAATEASQTPGTPEYKELHNYLGNMQALAQNLSYVDDFAQRVAGTKAKSALAKYYPPEAIKMATDVLSGHEKLSDLGKDGNKVSDLVDQMRGYDNVISTLARRDFHDLMAPDIKSILSRTLSGTKDAAGKYTVDEKKLTSYQIPEEVVSRVIDQLGQTGLTFPDSQLKQMPKIIGNIMKSMVREQDAMGTETPPQKWQGYGQNPDFSHTPTKPQDILLEDGHVLRMQAQNLALGKDGAPIKPNVYYDSAENPIKASPTGQYGLWQGKMVLLALYPKDKKAVKYMDDDEFNEYVRQEGKSIIRPFPLSTSEFGDENRIRFNKSTGMGKGADVLDVFYKDHPEIKRPDYTGESNTKQTTPAVSSSQPEITSQAQLDALPKGAKYTFGGKPFIKK